MAALLGTPLAPLTAAEVAADGADSPEALRALSLVPRPAAADLGPGRWLVPAEVRVAWGPVAGDEVASVAERLDLTLGPLGRRWRPVAPGQAADLRFEAVGPPGEASVLEVGPDGVTIRASDPEGRYSALVTLAQLLPPRGRSDEAARAQAGRWEDRPALGWRGLMVDSSRHFQTVAGLQWVLELMALHKLNRFHWHLSDDQGWRFEVPGWPKLTEVGAWRAGAGGRPYGGFYSRADVAQVVAYAARRHIVVVPEVDLPGHASAALAAYPELSSDGRPRSVPLDWAVADGVLSLGKPEVDRFADDVLAALKAQFPGPWIHWGGDEVYRHPFLKTKEGQAWMAKNRAATGDEAVARWWSALAQKTLAAGRVPVGWDEAALRSPPAGTLIQWWDDPARAATALAQGRDVIVSVKESLYLDYPEWDHDGDRAWWMPTSVSTSLAALDLAVPGAPAMGTPRAGRVVGLEATLFTERATEGSLARKLFPRLALAADLAWTGTGEGSPSAEDRLARAADHRDRLEAWGVGMPPPAQ